MCLDCAAGDDYLDNNGQLLKNYAAFIELDSLEMATSQECGNVSGYTIAGCDIEETEGGEYLFAGNQLSLLQVQVMNFLVNDLDQNAAHCVIVQTLVITLERQNPQYPLLYIYS